MDRINATVDDLQRRFDNLTPAHRISNCLQALAVEGSKNPDEIISLIRLEPLLATRIMREANQLPQAKKRPFASIEDAATAIGFKQMYKLLALYASQHSQDDKTQECYTTEHWSRAITTAVCMESLAAKHRIEPQQAYAIGLLHSLVPAIQDARNEAEPLDDTFGDMNERHNSFSSSSWSYTLFREWNFPDSFIDPIRYQYSPLDCQTQGKMACLLNLSKWITGVIREIDELPDQIFGPDVLVLNLLGEGEQTLWNLVSDVSDSLHRADALLQGRYTLC